MCTKFTVIIHYVIMIGKFLNQSISKLHDFRKTEYVIVLKVLENIQK